MSTGSNQPNRPARRARRLLAIALGAAGALALSAPAAAPAVTAGPSGDRLTALSNAVERSGVDGISWHVDSAAKRVVVTADTTVSAADFAALKRSAGADASAIRFERTPGVLRPLVSAGDAIYGSRYRCSLGFNVVKGSTYYFLTAGHCGKSEKNWYTSSSRTHPHRPDDGLQLPRQRLRAGALRQPLAVAPRRVLRRRRVRRREGRPVTARRPASTPGRSPRSTRRSATRAAARSSGLIQTNVCAEPGDSGGPLYDGTQALGLTSGGSGDCSTGGTTFFQPVREAVNVYGVTVY